MGSLGPPRSLLKTWQVGSGMVGIGSGWHRMVVPPAGRHGKAPSSPQAAKPACLPPMGWLVGRSVGWGQVPPVLSSLPGKVWGSLVSLPPPPSLARFGFLPPPPPAHHRLGRESPPLEFSHPSSTGICLACLKCLSLGPCSPCLSSHHQHQISHSKVSACPSPGSLLW